VVGQLLEDRQVLEQSRERSETLQAMLDSRAKAVESLQRSCESARDRLSGAIGKSNVQHDASQAQELAEHLFEAAVDAENMIENALSNGSTGTLLLGDDADGAEIAPDS